MSRMHIRCRRRLICMTNGYKPMIVVVVVVWVILGESKVKRCSVCVGLKLIHLLSSCQCFSWSKVLLRCSNEQRSMMCRMRATLPAASRNDDNDKVNELVNKRDRWYINISAAAPLEHWEREEKRTLAWDVMMVLYLRAEGGEFMSARQKLSFMEATRKKLFASWSWDWHNHDDDDDDDILLHSSQLNAAAHWICLARVKHAHTACCLALFLFPKTFFFLLSSANN